MTRAVRQDAGRVGLREVAARAGVSPKTVSNVVNGYAHVSPETRRRVEQAVAELNYRPNLSARNLRRGRTGVVALCVPELAIPYFAELAGHVVAAAERHGWTVLIDQTDGRPERERLVLEGLRSELIDGLLFSPNVLGRDELLARTDPTPLVLLGERVFDGPADHVAIDNVRAAQDATQHLLELGRRRVAAVGDQPGRGTGVAALRRQGYERALRDAGVPVDPALVAVGEDFHRADGARAAAALLQLDDPPDALFCFNDLLALGAMHELHRRGVRVPDDIAVVGVDDVEESQYAVPSLTTVRPDKALIAQLAVGLLASRLAGGTTSGPQELTAPHELVVRESTVGAREAAAQAVPAQDRAAAATRRSATRAS